MGRFKSKRQKKIREEQKARLEARAQAQGLNSTGDDRDSKDGRNWRHIDKKNEDFEVYYKAQKILPEEEWDIFMSKMAENLPSAFRITASCPAEANVLRKIIESDQFNNILPDAVEQPEANGDCKTDDEKLAMTNKEISLQNQQKSLQTLISDPLKCLEWHPKRLAWQMNASRVDIKKIPTLKKLQNFLVSEAESGFISRQEAVSMVPPLLLDIRPGQKVLDMCAAPGSKTAQIIEMLRTPIFPNVPTPSIDEVEESLIVANDVDNERCYMLVHQSKRLHSPSCIIVNEDAGNMPQLYDCDPQGDLKTGIDTDNLNKKPLKFDRVLCDAPCSGDGTARKNYAVWLRWNPANGNNFHSVQHRIAKRGLELLKKDGLMVYSTCSMNPIEDEAVIASLLNASKGGLELVDVSDQLPGLKRAPGMKKWICMTREREELETYDQVPDKYKTQIREQMFPPPNIDELHIERCMRIYPHYQNTGGFFVALLRKLVDTLPWEEDAENPPPPPTMDDIKNIEEVSQDDQSKDQTSKPPPRKRRKKEHFSKMKEEPFILFGDARYDPDPETTRQEWEAIKKFYRISDAFRPEQLLHRCSIGKKRNLYYVSRALQRFLLANAGGPLKVVNAGVRLFAKADEDKFDSPFRLTQEGIPLLFPYMGNNENIVEITEKDFIKLLSNHNVENSDLDRTVRERIMTLPSGSCCLVYKQMTEDENGQKAELVLPVCGWKGKSTTRAYVGKNEIHHYLRICYRDADSRLPASSNSQKQPVAKSKDEEPKEEPIPPPSTEEPEASK